MSKNNYIKIISERRPLFEKYSIKEIAITVLIENLNNSEIVAKSNDFYFIKNNVILFEFDRHANALYYSTEIICKTIFGDVTKNIYDGECEIENKFVKTYIKSILDNR